MEAQHLLSEINAIINSDAPLAEKTGRLSQPAKAVCKFCSFRPSCAAYFQLINEKNNEDNWPVDIKGRTLDKRRLGNGKTILKLASGKSRTFSIRGLTQERHEALREESAAYVVFSVRKESDNSLETFIEGPLTTIYRTNNSNA